MAERTGGCLCGAVRYRVTAEPVTARVCWCRDCQHISGNGTANALFASAAIEVTGSTNEIVRPAESGNLVTRRFCPQCGVHLIADSSGRPGFTVLRIGTLDDPSSVKPLMNIWASSAPSWACLDTSLERAEKQPAAPNPVASPA